MATASQPESELRLYSLRCDFIETPIATQSTHPRLSWALSAQRRGVSQASCHVLAASTAELLASGIGDLWDSGVVVTDDPWLDFAGVQLASAQSCYWCVEVVTDDGTVTRSEPARFDIGLLHEGDWLGAEWVTTSRPNEDTVDVHPSPYLRRTFEVDHPFWRARIYATAAGIYELECNGTRVGNARLTPGWTDFHQRLNYQAYDVTELLRSGENVLGAILADGWYAGFVGTHLERQHWGKVPALKLVLNIDYVDGSVRRVFSDQQWRACFGPVRAADLYRGETYDARYEIAGWSQPGFDDVNWWDVHIATEDMPTGVLVAQPCAPPRAAMELAALSRTEPISGSHVFDLGQNIVGHVRLRAHGPAGTIVRMRFAEALCPDGTIYTDNLRTARATDTYILRGDGEEVWEPRFTFHGFRYVEVTGLPVQPGLEAVTGIVVSSMGAGTFDFACSNDMVNQLHSNIVWGQRGNFLEIPTDCPQRDERIGWTGDAQVFATTACYNGDVAAFLLKWLDDVVDAQNKDNGAFPDFAPKIPYPPDGAPGWGDAGVIVPWALYQAYGDRRILRRMLEPIKAWVAYVHTHNPDLLWREAVGLNWSDWLAHGAETPKDVVATAYFGWSARLLARMARVLDDPMTSAHEALADDIAAAFEEAFTTADGKVIGDTQTGYALALRFGLLSPERAKLAAGHLAADVKARQKISTGFLGVSAVLPALTLAGRLDLAYQLLLSEEFPSWGYTIKHGATTMWERWDGWTTEAGFQDPSMNSLNHYAFGAVGEWIYDVVAGIRTAPAQPGYRHVIFEARPGGGLEWARGRYTSHRGPIESAWRCDDDAYVLDVELPPTSTGTVIIPALPGATITEGGQHLDDANGIVGFTADEDEIRVTIGSGRYSFAVHPGRDPN